MVLNQDLDSDPLCILDRKNQLIWFLFLDFPKQRKLFRQIICRCSWLYHFLAYVTHFFYRISHGFIRIQENNRKFCQDISRNFLVLDLKNYKKLLYFLRFFILCHCRIRESWLISPVVSSSIFHLKSLKWIIKSLIFNINSPT